MLHARRLIERGVQTMRKLLIMLITLSFFSLAACGKKEQKKDEKPMDEPTTAPADTNNGSMDSMGDDSMGDTTGAAPADDSMGGTNNAMGATNSGTGGTGM